MPAMVGSDPPSKDATSYEPGDITAGREITNEYYPSIFKAWADGAYIRLQGVPCPTYLLRPQTRAV